MEPPSSPSSTITNPPCDHETAQRLAKLIAEAMTCCFALLHYDSVSKLMVEWCWPADGEGRKIPPSDLEKYHKEYDIRYPCCLCADGGGRGAYVEAAVYHWWNTTTRKTYWIARCASNRCGYQVKIDKYFQLAPMATFQYWRREHQIPPVQLEWTFWEQTKLLNKLDSSVGDGIAAKEFCVLFKRCKMQASRSETSNEPPCLFRPGANATRTIIIALTDVSDMTSCNVLLTYWIFAYTFMST
ncbi:uncharacterized protein EDB91DRAFT_1088420 [Suillus paluster]|uniref:uncharacterized protein n=1 Tax=Suillus paluster TaxID=48578 RepID=UPI001B882D31|nr:uncharacterized protein EDB91DRAFT_1088420 [Suillus paluster]KAG1721498.1 hypothetical protein EDB91DRAFT_1088420 [Suillus paluster]